MIQKGILLHHKWVKAQKKKRWIQTKKELLELQKVLLEHNILEFTNALYTLHETVSNYCSSAEAKAEICSLLSMIPNYQAVRDQILACEDHYLVRRAIFYVNQQMNQGMTSLLLYFDQYQVSPGIIFDGSSYQKKKKSTSK